MIFVHPSVTANNLQELIALGKKQKLSYGSAGAGSTPHLTGERLLKIMAGLEVTHIPYSSAAPAMLAVAAGQVPLDSLPCADGAADQSRERLKDRRHEPQRMPSLPDVATVAESGFPGYEDYTWIAFFAPTGTPKAYVPKTQPQHRRRCWRFLKRKSGWRCLASIRSAIR
jgi:tripartite-type tricarboxylate transporter receptor subunit TctC